MKTVKILLFVVIVSLGFLFVHTNVWAVPSLGVGTNGGYTTAPEDFDDEDLRYIEFFGDVSGVGSPEGFRIEGSGSDLHVFTNILNEDIWLLAENAFTGNDLNFNGTDLVLDSFTAKNDKIAAYNGPFLGTNLGPVFTDDILNDGWELLPAEYFQTSPYYQFTGGLTFTGSLPEGSYLFAVADDGNEFYDLGNNIDDEFSPKTSSSTSVPEPSTMLLLGVSLAGLGLYGRQKAKKK